MHMRAIFDRLAAAAAIAALAINTGGPAAGSAIKVDHLAFGIESCPFVATDDRSLLFDTASIALLRPDSGFECPIDRMASAS